MEGSCLFAGERDAPDALALPRAAPNNWQPTSLSLQPNVVALRHGQAPRRWDRESRN